MASPSSPAFLDDCLDVLLRAAFIDEPDAVGRIIGPGRPLESFGARAHLAYCIGLLGLYQDINQIREIRNDFAHRQPTNFDTGEIRCKCSRLRCIDVLVPDGDCTPRDRFIVNVVLIANHLVVAAGQQPHAIPVVPFSENGVLRLK